MPDPFLAMRRLDPNEVVGCLRRPDNSKDGPYVLRAGGLSRLHDFVSACHRHLGQNRLGPGEALTENAKSILVELMIRWVDPRQRDSLPTLEQTALESARVMLRNHHTADTKTPAEWVIEVLEFYENYYTAKLVGQENPQMDADTSDPVALEVIQNFKNRAGEFTFDPERQKLRYATPVPAQVTAPTNPDPNAILTQPLINAGPRCRKRHQSHDLCTTVGDNNFSAAFMSNRV